MIKDKSYEYSDSDIDFLVRYFVGDYVYNQSNYICKSDINIFKLILGSICIDYIINCD